MPMRPSEVPKTVRAFVALPVSAGQRNELVRCIAAWRETAPETVRDFRLANPGQAHLTLVFLGEIDVAALPTLANVGREVARRHAPFVWSLGSLRGEPDASHARLVWLEVARGRDEIVALQADLEAALRATALYRPERRRFHPHVSFARARSKAAPLPDLPPAVGAQATARVVTLVGSRLAPQGAQHEVLATAQLGHSD